MNSNLRLQIGSPLPEDDTAFAYEQVAENRAAATVVDQFQKLLDGVDPIAAPAPGVPAAGGGAAPVDPDFERLMQGGGETAPPAGATKEEQSGVEFVSPPARVKPEEGDGEDLQRGVMDWAKAIAKDVGVGLTEAPKQVIGGVVDALGEVDQFMQQAIPIGGLQLFDDAGNFDPSFLSGEQMIEAAKAEEDLFSMIAPEDADTVTGGFVRATAQFLTGFIPGMQATKGLQAVAGGKFLSSMAAGAIADMVVFDPDEDRLSTFLNQIPALDAVVPDYLASNEPDQSHWEGRLKNAIEGAGLGLATDGLMSAFKYYKAARAAKAKRVAAADPTGATVQAAKDTLQQAAREELVNDIPDEALLPLGDAAPDAPLVVKAAPDEPASVAMARIKEARARAEAVDVNDAALTRVNQIRDDFATKRQVPAGRDPMDEMLDELRSGAVSTAKIPKRPVAEIIKKIGGIDPRSSLAGDLRSRGVTAKTFPGLFRKGGAQSLDNIPAAEVEIFSSRNIADPATGYIPQQSFIDALEAELKGDPWLAPADRQLLDDIISPLDELEQHLDQLGIDYRNMSNESVRARMQQIADEDAIFRRDMGLGAERRAYTETELYDMEIEDLQRMAFGRASGDVIDVDPSELIPNADDMVNPEDLFAKKGMAWANSVDLSEPIEIALREDGTMQIIDGHHRYFAALKRGEKLKANVEVRGNAVRKILKDQETAGVRTLEDLEKEIAEEAAARGVDPAVVRAEKQPKIYINHARINSAEDVKAVLQEFADMDADAINAKRRGVVTNEQTIRESSREYQDLNDLLGRAPGPMTASQAVAARRLLAASGEQIVQLAKLAQAPEATPADLFNFRRAMSVHYALQSEVIAARTETARALQAWSIPAGATKARSQAINDLIAASGGAGDMQQLAKTVAAVGDNPTALNTMARELGRGRFGKALYQVWINGLLSSPKTHMVNITSNAMNSLYAIPERYMAAGISKVFYNGEIKAGEASAQAFGLVKGIRDGFRLVAMGNKASGDQGLSDVFDAFAKIEGTQTNAISAAALGLDDAGSLGYGIDMLGKLVNIPGSMLNAEDKFFKALNYRMELQARAFRQAAQEGLEGEDFAKRVADVLNNPPENLKAEAIDFAHYQTFTNPLSGGARQALGGIAKTPYIGPVFRVVVPFVKTPTNIMKYTFARTPLAYASSAIRADISAGGARAAQAHARIALGSMIMLTITDMVAEGTITGGGPLADDMSKTAQLRATRRAAGAPPPYSVKIGDRWYAYNRLDPIGMMMGMGADMAEVFASASEADSEMLAGAGVLAVAQNLASKTYLSGVFDFMAAIDPHNQMSDPGKYVSDLATGLVPYSSFMRNVAQTMDPIQRDAKAVEYGDDGKVDPVATYIQATIDKVKRGIPGLSDTLPPMRDLWGEPIDRSSGIGWGWDFVSPVASKADNPDPVTKVILDNRIAVSFPPRRIEGVQLTPEEYDQFSELAGKMARDSVARLVNSPGFDKLSPGPEGMKAELIKAAISDSREYARGQMMMRNPEIRDRAIGLKLDEMKSLTGQ